MRKLLVSRIKLDTQSIIALTTTVIFIVYLKGSFKTMCLENITKLWCGTDILYRLSMFSCIIAYNIWSVNILIFFKWCNLFKMYKPILRQLNEVISFYAKCFTIFALIGYSYQLQCIPYFRQLLFLLLTLVMLRLVPTPCFFLPYVYCCSFASKLLHFLLCFYFCLTVHQPTSWNQDEGKAKTISNLHPLHSIWSYKKGPS